MRNITVRGIVTNVANAVNTREGNPQMRVNITGDNGEEYEFLTAPDSQLAYRIGNPEYRDRAHTFYIDSNGRIGTRAGF
jgi:hypothetical protein